MKRFHYPGQLKDRASQCCWRKRSRACKCLCITFSVVHAKSEINHYNYNLFELNPSWTQTMEGDVAMDDILSKTRTKMETKDD